jgi:hypothetical protein
VKCFKTQNPGKTGAVRAQRCSDYFNLLTSLVSFDFRFEALFVWMTFFPAILSRNETVSFKIACAVSLLSAVRTFFNKVFIVDFTATFRLVRRSVERMRLT